MTNAIERIWQDRSGWPAVARTSLLPASLLYRGLTTVRNALYDRRLMAVHPSALPVVSVGNLTVGGTGKTPVSAWMVRELASRGARPVLILRGYGGDEPLVHAALNPDLPVIVNRDRTAAIADAAGAGRDVAVLDDAFQHRRTARLEDVVLVSADRWRPPHHVLPAGPWREPITALRRATMVIVTRKAASRQEAALLAGQLAARTRGGRSAVAFLSIGPIIDFRSGTTRHLSSLQGASVLLAAGVGDPASLAAQLRAAGARVTLRVFPDHHVYESADIASLVADGNAFDVVICTLKDAVKLGPRWPREAGPLWYVSQRCELEDGGADVSALLDRLLMARSDVNE